MKTAVILVGGGMRSAHGGGFLYALATELGITTPDIMIGSSGDAGNVAYFAAGQYERFWSIWTKHVSTPKFVSPWRFWKMLDVDYLVDTVFKKLDPLDTAKLLASPVHWFVPVTNFDTGKTQYVSAKDGIDPFEMLRAAKAIPVWFGKKVPLIRGRYIDGELGPTLEDHVRFAIGQGANKILLINHTAQWTRSSRAALRIYGAFTPEDMNTAIERDITTGITCVTMPNATILCVMAQDVGRGTAIREPRELERIFNRGVEDALAMRKELQELFGKTPADAHQTPMAA